MTDTTYPEIIKRPVTPPSRRELWESIRAGLIRMAGTRAHELKLPEVPDDDS